MTTKRQLSVYFLSLLASGQTFSSQNDKNPPLTVVSDQIDNKPNTEESPLQALWPGQSVSQNELDAIAKKENERPVTHLELKLLIWYWDEVNKSRGTGLSRYTFTGDEKWNDSLLIKQMSLRQVMNAANPFDSFSRWRVQSGGYSYNDTQIKQRIESLETTIEAQKAEIKELRSIIQQSRDLLTAQIKDIYRTFNEIPKLKKELTKIQKTPYK